MLRVLLGLLLALSWLSAREAGAIGSYADWSLSSGVSGTGSFGGVSGMPDFTFTLSGDLTPADTEINTRDEFDFARWERLFGDGDGQGSLRFRSPGRPGVTVSTLVIRFANPTTPTRPWGFAVTDLEGEDAVIEASLGGVPVGTSVLSSWFQDLFDSRPATTGSPHLPSGYDAGAGAVVAEFDPDGLLSDEVLSPPSGTESASAWFLPDAPIDTLRITHRNRFGGSASMHVYMAVVPEPASVALVAIGLAGMAGYRMRRPRSPRGR